MPSTLNAQILAIYWCSKLGHYTVWVSWQVGLTDTASRCPGFVLQRSTTGSGRVTGSKLKSHRVWSGHGSKILTRFHLCRRRTSLNSATWKREEVTVRTHDAELKPVLNTGAQTCKPGFALITLADCNDCHFVIWQVRFNIPFSRHLSHMQTSEVIENK